VTRRLAKILACFAVLIASLAPEGMAYGACHALFDVHHLHPGGRLLSRVRSRRRRRNTRKHALHRHRMGEHSRPVLLWWDVQQRTKPSTELAGKQSNPLRQGLQRLQCCRVCPSGRVPIQWSRWRCIWVRSYQSKLPTRVPVPVSEQGTLLA
jgi:hypothetical protein